MLITLPAPCCIRTRTKATVAQFATQLLTVCGRRGTGPHLEPAQSSPHPLPTTFTSSSLFYLRLGSNLHIVTKFSCACLASTFVLHSPPTLITLIHPINGFLNTTNYEPPPLTSFCILVPTQPPIQRVLGFLDRGNVAEA